MWYQYKTIQYNSLHVKLNNLKLNKLKSGIKNSTEITLNLSSNVTGDSNSKTNILHKLLLTDRKISRLCKSFANNS